MTRVFISYRHSDGEWVWNRLKPCLDAGEAEVLIDRERFQAGIAVVGQMDAIQEKAHVHVLIITKEYLASDYCRHEMDRAVALDPDFQNGIVVPVRRDDHRPWPRQITRPNPLYVNLRDDADAGQWSLLLRACGADLGTTAPGWLQARDEVVRCLERNESVNLIIRKREVKWEPLINHIRDTALPDLKCVDLQTGRTASRRGLLTDILDEFGVHIGLASRPEDLVEFERIFESLPKGRLAITHFDLAGIPDRQQEYGIDLFAMLRHLTMKKKLILLIESHREFASLLPPNHPLSEMDLKTVELQ